MITLTATSAGAAEPTLNPPRTINSRTCDVVSRVENLAGTERRSWSRTETTYSLQASVLFAKDSSEISPRAKKKIDDLADEIVRNKPTKPVTIVGYTDNLGSADHGLKLSRQRASAVKAVLEENSALAQNTLTAKGLGEGDPIADNATEAGRQKNRRVEIVVPTPD
ncbi:OmpA family protein [Streptomyces sp. NPDC087532]|uniref:OmpA family protein n=1 Tax=Streptomyces sp. NPDC087532 TaxID=3365795 RepID=UPI0037FFA420